MKNVTIALDDEIHRKARIRAAELGTSLSALVKEYLNGLADGLATTGVRDVQTNFAAEPVQASSSKPGKLRQPGALRGMIGMADDFDPTPEWLLDAFEGKDSHLPWPE